MADEFIKVMKDGEEPIWIHPLALEDHKRLGWKVVSDKADDETEIVSESTESDAEKGKKPIRRRAG